MRKRTRIVVAQSVFVAIVVWPATHALTITVTNTNDTGPGSLRQSIIDALPGDEIQFDPSLDGQPIALTSGQLVIDKDLVITGRGPHETIVDGSSQSPVLHIGPFNVALSGATIRNGRGSYPVDKAGGIHNEGTLTLDDVAVIDNVFSGHGGHAAIYNLGTLTVTASIVSGNRGSICVVSSLDGVLTINQSTVSDNVGGGIGAHGELMMNESTVHGNRGNYWGGVSVGGTITVRNSTISHNLVWWGDGAGIAGGGQITVDNSTISDNWARFDGGGILFSGPFGGTLAVSNSTINGNRGLIGGGILVRYGSVVVSNSIVAQQVSGGDCLGAINSAGHNLDSDGTCNLTQSTDLPNTDPLLSPLAHNGGPTHTCALSHDSPAIDAGADCGAMDQRGVPRPWDGDRDGVSKCDIGAFEYRPVVLIGDLHDLILVLIGQDNDLIGPLQAAIQILEDGEPSNDGRAAELLQAFIAEVEERRGWTLTDHEADELITEAQRILGLLGSGGSAVSGAPFH